jgi:hypothetical protein
MIDLIETRRRPNPPAYRHTAETSPTLSEAISGVVIGSSVRSGADA